MSAVMFDTNTGNEGKTPMPRSNPQYSGQPNGIINSGSYIANGNSYYNGVGDGNANQSSYAPSRVQMQVPESSDHHQAAAATGQGQGGNMVHNHPLQLKQSHPMNHQQQSDSVIRHEPQRGLKRYDTFMRLLFFYVAKLLYD